MAISKLSWYSHAVVALLSAIFIALTPSMSAQTPIAWWMFDDAAGTTAVDSSGNGHPMTLVNGPVWATGKIAGAVTSTGGTAYLNAPAIDLSATNAVTVAMWVNRTYSKTGSHTLFENSANYNGSTTGFGIFPDDTTSGCNGIQAAIHGNVGYSVNCYAQPTSGVWHHLAFVFDKSQASAASIKFYLDGVLQTATSTPLVTTNTNAFGVNLSYLLSRGGTAEYAAGTIDDLRVYNTALSSTAVQSIYSAGNLSSVVVTPASPQIAKGALQQFAATGTYGDGSTHSLTPYVTWTSGTPAVASIGTGGLATSLSAGTTLVAATATISPVAGSTTLTVTPPALVSISVTPSTSSIVSGSSLQFTATGTYSDGSTLNLTNSATWSSLNTAVATVSATGLSGGLSTGTTQVLATYLGQQGTASLKVTPPLVSITVTPAAPSIPKGRTQQFTATGNYSDGSTQNLTSSVTWNSSTTSVASIISTGLASGVAQGSTTITASSGTVSGSAGLTVAQPALSSITVTPANGSIIQGGASQLVATGTYTDGTTQNLTSSVTWSSSAPAVATVSSTGVTSGLTVGSTNMTAVSGSISGSTSLGVAAPVPGLVGYWTFDEGTGTTAGDSSGSGNTMTLANGVAWINGQIGSAISAAGSQSGIIPAINFSTATGVTTAFWLNHTYSAVGGHVLVENSANYNSSTTGFVILPDDDTCGGIQAAVHGNVGYTANCFAQPTSGVWHHLAFVFDKTQTGAAQVKFYLDGVQQAVTKSLFTSTNTGTFGTNPTYIFARGGNSLFTSGEMDDLRIYNNALAQSQIQELYSGASLITIAVTPANASIPAGGSQQYTASGTYGDGSKHTLTSQATWSSSTANATISAAGLAIGATQGTTNIQAQVGSLTGATQLTIGAPALVSIKLSPATASIVKGATQQFAATGNYSDGSTRSLTASAQWQSSNTSVVTVNSGLATGAGVGSGTITATSGGLSASAQVSVTLALASIAITPASPSVAKGNTLQLTAIATYSDGSTQNVTNSVTWNSGSTSIATINSTGLLQGAGVGSASVTAVSGTVSGSVSVTVTAPTLLSVAVTPANSLLAIGNTAQFTATGTYSDGSTQNLTSSSTWTSSNTAIATVSSGSVTGVSSGAVTIGATSAGVSGSTNLSVVSANFPGIPYDMWIDFEHDTTGAGMSATELAASTHGTAGAWTVNDSNGLLTTQSAAQNPSSSLTGDSGNRGLAYNLANGSTANIQWSLPAAQSALSFGLWYKTGQPGAFVEGPHLITMYNWGAGNMLRLSDERSSANNARQIRVSPLDNAITVTDNTWYWLTMKWTQNGAGTFNVYDTSLNLVGTVNFTDTFNSPTNAIQLGNTSGTSGQTGESTYFDDLIIDYTFANFPLLPQISASISVSLSPSTVTNGASSTGTITLDAPAPAGGATVGLASGNSAVAGVPSSVTVPAGLTTATFPVNSGGVTFATQVSLTATYGSLIGSAILTVNPTNMAQVATDPFNRADNATLGSNWTPLTGSNNGTLQLVGSTVEATALSPTTGKEMYYGGLTWGPDQYSEVTIVSARGTGYAGPAVRMTSNDSHYDCVVYSTSANNASIAILRSQAGTSTVLASSSTATVNAGDTVRCSVQGTVVTMSDRTNSVVLLTATDAVVTSGYPGLVDSAGSNALTDYTMINWAGGDLAAPATLTQLASDNFNRPDALNLGPNWDIGTGHGPLQIVGQQVEPYAAGGVPPSKEHYVGAGAFPNDQWSQLQVVVEDALGDNAVELRASDTADTLYVLDVNLTGAAGTAETRIALVVNGVITALVVDQTWSVVNPGDYIRGQVQGNLLSLIDVTTGTLLLSASDTTVSSGYPGISMQILNGVTSDHIAANWSGGVFH